MPIVLLLNPLWIQKLGRYSISGRQGLHRYHVCGKCITCTSTSIGIAFSFRHGWLDGFHQFQKTTRLGSPQKIPFFRPDHIYFHSCSLGAFWKNKISGRITVIKNLALPEISPYSFFLNTCANWFNSALLYRSKLNDYRASKLGSNHSRC